MGWMSRAYDWPASGSVGTSKRVGSAGPKRSSSDELVRVGQAATATTASAVARRRSPWRCSLLAGGSCFDEVQGIWYGSGLGVDRALRHHRRHKRQSEILV